MRKCPIQLLLPVLFCVVSLPAQAESMTLWYEQPARKWVEALPVGNGSIAIIGNREEQLDRIKQNVLDSVTWST